MSSKLSNRQRAVEIANVFIGNGLSHNQQTEKAYELIQQWRIEDLSDGRTAGLSNPHNLDDVDMTPTKP